MRDAVKERHTGQLRQEVWDMKQMAGKKSIVIAVAAVVAVCAAVAGFLIFRGGANDVYRSIRIVELDGGVKIARENIGDLDASVNMNLISGDRVSTDAGSYVVLRLDDDKYVMLGEQGAMQVEAEGSAAAGKTKICLESGSVLNEIQNPLGADSTYEIVTPSATMSVRGTVFEARSDENGTVDLLVYEGKVAVNLEDGTEASDENTVLYLGGEYAQIASTDGKPEFVTEHSFIGEEQIDAQMISRLLTINDSGRTLNFGRAEKEELEERAAAAAQTKAEEDASQNEEKDESDTVSPEETDEPEDTEVSEETEAPAPSEKVASNKADRTPEPTQQPTAAPTVTPKPTAASASSPKHTPAPTSKPTEAPKPTSKPTEAPKPTSKPTEAPKPTDTPKPADTPTPTDTPKPETKTGTVTFYDPDVTGIDLWGGRETIEFSDGNANATVHDTQQVAMHGTVSAPKALEPRYGWTVYAWYTRGGQKWDFTTGTLEQETLELYPAWEYNGIKYRPQFPNSDTNAYNYIKDNN